MRWFVVLLLGGFTFGIFSIVWAFVIPSFVKKIAPKCNGRGLLFAALAFAVLALLPRGTEAYVIVDAPVVAATSLRVLPLIINRGQRAPSRRP